MPQLHDLIASMGGALSVPDSGAPLGPRDRAQNQLAHSRLGFAAGAVAASLLHWAGLPDPVAWSALLPLALWAGAEAVQLRRVRWSAAHGWDMAADLCGWGSGWVLLGALALSGAQPGGWMLAAGLWGLCMPVAVGAGYWLKYGGDGRP